MKQIYLIRHCEAEGQPAEALLTEAGNNQAIQLAEFLSPYKIDRIISSPFKRAIQSIQPLARQKNIEVESNSRLSERVLSSENLPDWFEKLRATFEEMELKFEGGESSQEAMNRIVEVVEAVFNSEAKNSIIVTHGNLMALLLKHYNDEFGFNDWINLSNPDVFQLTYEFNKVTFKRVWNVM